MVKTESVWKRIDQLLRKSKLTKKEKDELKMRFDTIKHYVKRGNEILDMIDEWESDQRKVIEKHSKKIDRQKSKLLAHMI